MPHVASACGLYRSCESGIRISAVQPSESTRAAARAVEADHAVEARRRDARGFVVEDARGRVGDLREGGCKGKQEAGTRRSEDESGDSHERNLLAPIGQRLSGGTNSGFPPTG